MLAIACNRNFLNLVTIVPMAADLAAAQEKQVKA